MIFLFICRQKGQLKLNLYLNVIKHSISKIQIKMLKDLKY